MSPDAFDKQFSDLLGEHMHLAPQALHTPGPKTLAGKQRVALNGVTHGLSGQNVFITEDEYPAYFQIGADYIAELQPVGVRETQLAQKVIDCNWRLNRLAAIENNLLNGMMAEISRNVQPSDPKSEVMLSQAEAFQTDCDGPNAFDKLGRYETRLSRMMFKMSDELERLQKIRLAKGTETFILEKCPAWLWYNRMLEVLQQRQASQQAAEQAAREAAKSPELNDIHTTELLGKKAFHAGAGSNLTVFPGSSTAASRHSKDRPADQTAASPGNAPPLD